MQNEEHFLNLVAEDPLISTREIAGQLEISQTETNKIICTTHFMYNVYTKTISVGLSSVHGSYKTIQMIDILQEKNCLSTRHYSPEMDSTVTTILMFGLLKTPGLS